MILAENKTNRFKFMPSKMVISFVPTNQTAFLIQNWIEFLYFIFDEFSIVFFTSHH